MDLSRPAVEHPAKRGSVPQRPHDGRSLDPEDLLQLLHLRAQARLRNAAALGRPVEAKRIGDRDDVLKLTDGEVVEGGHGRGTLTLT